MNAADTNDAAPRRRRLSPWLWAAGGYAAFAVAATWPAARYLGQFAIGGVRDVWVMIWSNWWFAEALLHRHVSPFFNPLVFYPFGMDMRLLEIHLVPAAVFMLLYPLAGQVAAYNLDLLLGWAASGMGLHALAHRLTGRHVPAFIAGLCFCSSSYMTGSAASGWVHMMHAEWLPLYVLAVLRMDERPSLGRGAAAGALLCLAANSAWYYGMYLIIFTGVFAAYKLATAPRDLARRRFALAALALLVVFLAGVLPVAGPTMRKMRRGKIVPKLKIPDAPAALVESFVPDKAALKRRAKWFAYACTYIGYATLALAAWGAWTARRRGRRPGLWLTVAGVSFVLAFGPRLHVTRERAARVAGRSIVMPDALVRRVLPFYRFCRNQWRHQVMLVLALSVLVGWAVHDLTRRARTRRGRAGVAAAAAGALLAEAALVSPPPFPTPLQDASLPKVYRPLLRARDHYALIVAPVSYKTLYYQTYHRRPIVGYTSRKKTLDPAQKQYAAELFEAADALLDHAFYGVQGDVSWARDQLRKAGVGYVVAHDPAGEDYLLRIR